MERWVTSERIEACGYQIPKKNREISGDCYYIKETKDYFLCGMADGLGSGEAAHEASSAVVHIMKENHIDDVHTLMRKCNEVLKKKRGAAVAILKVDYQSEEFVYSCVGNISFFLYTPFDKLIYPLPVMGYLSGKPQHFYTQRFPYQKNSIFLFHTDGLRLPSVKSLLKNIPKVNELVLTLKRYEEHRNDDFTFVAGILN